MSGPDGVGVQADHAYTLEARAEVQAIAFNWNAQAAQLPSAERDTSINDGLTCSQQGAVAAAMQVRRLTPRECERLQGFPDNYTMIPWRKKPADECPDGPRYKALGNSWAVPCVQWIGRRLTAQLRNEPVTTKPVLVMHESVRALFHAFLRRIRRAESTTA